MTELREPSERVSPRARTMWTLGALGNSVFTLGVLALVAYVWAPFAVPWWAFALLVVGSAAYTVLMPRWRYAVHRWEATETAVYTQTGWWSIERRIAPMSRIQTVDTQRGPLEQAYRLSSVTVTTASAAGPLKIRGLDHEVAADLAQKLTEVTQSHRGDAT